MDSCVIQLTEAAHKYGNLNIRPCGRDFFPPDAFGGSSKKAGIGIPITLKVDGLSNPIETDIPKDKTGKPRWIFRKRIWVKDFVHCHKLHASDTVIIERLAKRIYEIRPNNNQRISCQANISKTSSDTNLPSPTTTGRPGNTLTNQQRFLLDETMTVHDSQFDHSKLDARKLNILNSPKRGGSSTLDSLPYLKELNVKIIENAQPIQFTPNINEHIHRWAPYVQGFSALFVQNVLDQYRKVYRNPVILDPFAGCGTVLVQTKLNGFKSIGTELNPLLHFIANTKLNCWDVSPSHLFKTYKKIPKDKTRPAPSFLKSTSQLCYGTWR